MYWRLVCVSVVLAACCLVDAAPSNNDTATTTTTTKPSNKGLGGLFSMTKGFINLVMTKTSIIGALNDAAGDKGNFFNGGLSESEKKSGYLKVAKETVTGYIICIAIGIIFMFVMPWVGCCFCCCRLTDNCGGKPRKADKGPDMFKKICFSVSFGIITAFMLGAMICIFLNISLIHDQTSKTSDNSIVNIAVTNLNRTEDYINAVIKDLKDVVFQGFDSTTKVVIQTLKDTAKTAKNKLVEVTNADDALKKAKELADKLKKVSHSLSEVNQITSALKDKTASLKNELDEVNANLTGILGNCNGTEDTCTEVLSTSESTLKLDADFNQVDNVSGQLDTVLDVNWEDLKANIEKSNEAVEKITRSISKTTDSATEDVKNKIDGDTRADLQMQTDDSSQEIKKIVNFESTRAKLNSQKDDINKYGNYIYYAGLGLGCVTLLIVLLYFLGLLFVILCGDKAPSCDQRTGTNFLMAGVGFTFIFALFLMLLTTLLFIVGAPLYSVTCRYTANLSDTALTKEFDLLLDAMEIDFGYNLTLSGVMAACGRDESIYNAARLGDRINIVEYLNISKYPFLTDAIDNLRSKAFDIGEVNILSDDTRNKLDKLINGSLDNINFTSFETQVNRDLTAGDLDILVAQIRDAVAKLKLVYPTTVVELQTQANKLEDIQTNTVKGLKVQKANLGIAVDKLKTILTGNGGFTEDTRRLLKNLQDAEEKITKKGNHLLTGIVAYLAENVLTEISRSLTGIAKKLTNDLGRCKEPLDIVQSTIDIGCVSVLGPFNGLWFSLGWFIFFSIFGIIFAVKLVGVVHAVEGPSAGSSGAIGRRHLDTIPMMNYQQLSHHDNSGYEKDNS